MWHPWHWTLEESRMDTSRWQWHPVVQDTDGVFVCAHAQPRQLPSEYGKRPRKSAGNWKFSTKPSTISKIHRCGPSLKISICHGVLTSLTVPTDGPDNRFWTGVRTHHAPTPFLKIRGNKRNRPQGKFREDDGLLRHRRTLAWLIEKLEKERICVSRRADNFQRHDGVKRDHPFGTDSGFQWQNPIVDTSNQWPEDMVTLEAVFHWSHWWQSIAVKTAGKGRYTVAVQKIYGVPPPPPEEHHEAVNDIHTTAQVMQTHRYKLDGMVQANAILNRYNSLAMEQLSQMTVTMRAMKAQLKTLASSQSN